MSDNPDPSRQRSVFSDDQRADEGDNLPEDVRSWLADLLGPGEKVEASLCADLLADGRYGERWAFLTPERFFVLSAVDGGAPRVELELAAEKITGARMRDFVSSGALEVRTPEEGVEAVRFTRGFRAEVADMCFSLEQVGRQNEALKNGATDHQRVPPPRYRLAAGRCSKCGRAMSRWSETCFHCLQRGRLVVRPLAAPPVVRVSPLFGRPFDVSRWRHSALRPRPVHRKGPL
jgi:hypothetical protein